jgi:hypothetical protein
MLIEEPRGRGVDLVGVSNLRKANGHLSASEPIALCCPSAALDRICVNAHGRPHRSLRLGGQFVRLEGTWLCASPCDPLAAPSVGRRGAAMGVSREQSSS